MSNVLDLEKQITCDSLLTVRVRGEFGYELALEGLSYNHDRPIEKMTEVIQKLAHKDWGHNKVLESIMLWLEVRAPRFWWAESDTYRIATKQSQSTMHTALKRELTPDDFSGKIVDIQTLQNLNQMVLDQNLIFFKKMLPEGFMQKRMWVFSYKTLRNIYIQRKKHRLVEWHIFLFHVLMNIKHPEFIMENPDEEMKDLLAEVFVGTDNVRRGLEHD